MLFWIFVVNYLDIFFKKGKVLNTSQNFNCVLPVLIQWYRCLWFGMGELIAAENTVSWTFYIKNWV